jgi:hypothetical protein
VPLCFRNLLPISFLKQTYTAHTRNHKPEQKIQERKHTCAEGACARDVTTENGSRTHTVAEPASATTRVQRSPGADHRRKDGLASKQSAPAGPKSLGRTEPSICTHIFVQRAECSSTTLFSVCVECTGKACAGLPNMDSRGLRLSSPSSATCVCV